MIAVNTKAYPVGTGFRALAFETNFDEFENIFVAVKKKDSILRVIALRLIRDKIYGSPGGVFRSMPIVENQV